MEVERMRSWLDPAGQSVTCTHMLINVCVCAYIHMYTRAYTCSCGWNVLVYMQKHSKIHQ